MPSKAPIIKSLNYIRPIHLPTYAGLRAILDVDNLHDRNIDFVSTLLRDRKFNAGKYKTIPRYKGINEEGELEYRAMSIPSPTALVMETYLLTSFARDPSFQIPENVYSYLWPYEKAGTIYKYFHIGYQQRNYHVRRLLSQSTNSRAVIGDIKGFYPSCNLSLLIPAFNNIIDKCTMPQEIKQMAKDAAGIQDKIGNCKGIPIGPPLSPVLANIYLLDFDKSMADKYGTNYTRYVDDIIVVCKVDEESEAKDFITNRLQELGLAPNSDKWDTVDLPRWDSHSPNYANSGNITFENWRNRIVCLLALKPELVAPLAESFHKAGFAIPIKRLAGQSRYGRFRYYLKWLFSSGKAHSFYFEILNDSVEKITNDGHRLLDALTERLASLEGPLEEHGQVRRWKIQEYRYCLNRLMYLIGSGHFAELLDMVPAESELQEQAAVIRALAERNVEYVFRYPGYAPLACGSLAFESGIELKMPEGINISTTPSEALESIASLALFGIRTNANSASISDDAYLKFCLGEKSETRHLTDLSYADEIECLSLIPRHEKITQYLNSRYDDLEEDIDLEALSIGSTYGIS